MLRENQTSPFRNAIPANTSSLGAYSAHGNRVLGEPAHGECKTVLITKTSWGFRFPVPKYLRISTSAFQIRAISQEQEGIDAFVNRLHVLRRYKVAEI
ncbi:hypothetical protein AV530_015560 [Patagioenas fasciata monilis]|uniref:Uncharacterized protein n=1 Tax=Patagioenas fasciata monilis TaxID=372326 RepID=A0A1V4KJP2_PATFA|nr:hypothetical protein AV530_015560 [Patagioenas fasciata monilis]